MGIMIYVNEESYHILFAVVIYTSFLEKHDTMCSYNFSIICSWLREISQNSSGNKYHADNKWIVMRDHHTNASSSVLGNIN